MDPFSFPQRIVLLIDLHPLNANPNPNSYIAPILTSIFKLLSFPPLSSSQSALSAHALFFSSLSPVLSESKLRHLTNPPPSSLLSFDRPSRTLDSLSRTLTLASSHLAGLADDPLPSPSLRSLARFLLRLEHDYSWEPGTAAPNEGNPGSLRVRSNLVLLFSPMYPEYIDRDESLDGFGRVFGPVSEKFASRDIHFTWVNVNFDVHREEKELGSGFLERGIRELNWGLCSTDEILLGSALLPFGLIFPYIGCSMAFRADSNVKKGRAELVLGITDVSGEPLECKSCNLEVIDLKLTGQRSDFWGHLADTCEGEMVKIYVTKVWRKHENFDFMEKSCGLVLLRSVSAECRNDSVEHSTKGFFADRVLELLCTEKGEIAEGKPIWQLLLAFLFNNNYWALVSLTYSNGRSFKGILKPFTINYALLSIIVKNSLSACQVAVKDSAESIIVYNSLSACQVAVKDSAESSATDLSRIKGDRRNRSKVHKKLIQNVTWSSFYEAAVTQLNYVAPERDLWEIYFAMECSLSKKLRFLKCWMRQVKKSRDCFQFKSSEAEEPLNVNEEREIIESQKDSEVDIPSPGREKYCAGPENEKLFFSCLEDVDVFIGSVPQKIKHGLYSVDVDLWHLARRLVGLSIDAFCFKLGVRSTDGPVSEQAKNASEPKVAAEVSYLLFLKPKDLVLKYKSFSSASLTSDQSNVTYSTEHRIREHELQILFRMELLKMEVAAPLEETVKQKMIKEICSLMQNIEFALQGDSFSGESLLEFAGRTIKSRYSHSLREIIRKIYEQMEFFSFDEEEVGASDSLPVSNGDEPHSIEDENYNAPKDASRSAGRVSRNQNAVHLQEDDANRQLDISANAHEIMLLKAQKQRDRARRFASFTSWVPDLHRVWACRQPRIEKPTQESRPKSKSKKRQRHESKGEIVCETPLTGKKNFREQEDGCRDQEAPYLGSKSCKALFQHEDDLTS